MRFLITIITLLALNATKAQDFKYGKISPKELREERHPSYPEAKAAILYRDSHSSFVYSKDSGFELETEFTERIKIYDPEGFKHATRQITLYKNTTDEEKIYSLKGMTYNLVGGKVVKDKLDNNAIFKEEKSRYQNLVKFTMPALRPGAVIEYKYKVKSPFLGNLDEVRFQEQIPVNNAEARYYFPEYFVYKMHRKGWLPFKVDESSRNRKISLGTTFQRGGNGFSTRRSTAQNHTLDMSEKVYKVGITNAPPLVNEQFSGNLDNYCSAIKFELSYTKFPQEPLKYVSSTWEDVTKTIYDSDSFGKELARSNYFEGDLDALLKDSNGTTDKTQLIYNYVKHHMTWNSYLGFYAEEGLKQAYKNRSGNTADINLMLVAMLRYAGIDANPVLISTKAHGIPLFPTRNGFNYVVAAVNKGDHYLLMDATDKGGKINLLDENLLNWNGRLIKSNGDSDWVSLAPRQHSTKNMMLNINLDQDLNLAAEASERLSGYHARNFRRQFGNLDEEGRRSKMETLNEGIELSDLHFTNLDQLDKPVALTYSFEALRGVERIGDKIIISPMFHLAMLENPFKSEERHYPIDFEFPRKNRYIISIAVPEGYKVEQLPESAAANLYGDLGKFSYRINNSSTGNIQLLCEQSINTTLVGAERYAELKKFYDMIVEKEQEKIILSKI